MRSSRGNYGKLENTREYHRQLQTTPELYKVLPSPGRNYSKLQSTTEGSAAKRKESRRQYYRQLHRTTEYPGILHRTQKHYREPQGTR